MDTTYIYLGGFIAIAIVIIVGLVLSSRFKFSLTKNKMNIEASKQEIKNTVSATNIINESDVEIKKGDNHNITVDKINKSKVKIQ